MKILIIDEDRRHLPEVIDLLRFNGHVVSQVDDWRDAVVKIREFDPDLLLLDLMMPSWDLNSSDCFGGYGTGAYVYETRIQKEFPSLKFIVFSGVDPGVSIVKRIIDRLKTFTTFDGFLSKNQIEELLKRVGSPHHNS